MRLLMITGIGSAKDLASGKRGAFFNTLEEFHKYWERIDIICPKTENCLPTGDLPKGGKLKTVNFFSNVYIHVLSSSFSLKHFFSYKKYFLEKAEEIYREQKFDLITVQDYPPFYNGYLAWKLWKKIKVPFISEIHHIPGYPKASNLRESIYALPVFWRFYWKFFGSKAKAVRVVNQKQTPEFLKKAGIPEEKIVYISSLYIDLEVFKPLGLTKEYDLIFVGRLVANKGIELLLKAIEFTISNFRFPIKCLIVGDGPLMESLKFKVKSLKLKNGVIFYGRAKDSYEVAQLMNKSKILIMPSYNEGGPRVVVEAMACGVSVLATAVGIVPDIIKPSQSGEIIDWQAEDIAEKACALLADPDRQARYGRAGTEIAKKFERKTMIKNYADQLKQISHTTYSRPSTPRSGVFE